MKLIKKGLLGFVLGLGILNSAFAVSPTVKGFIVVEGTDYTVVRMGMTFEENVHSISHLITYSFPVVGDVQAHDVGLLFQMNRVTKNKYTIHIYQPAMTSSPTQEWITEKMKGLFCPYGETLDRIALFWANFDFEFTSSDSSSDTLHNPYWHGMKYATEFSPNEKDKAIRFLDKAATDLLFPNDVSTKQKSWLESEVSLDQSGLENTGS